MERSEVAGSRVGAGATTTPRAACRLAWLCVPLALALLLAGSMLSATEVSVGDLLIFSLGIVTWAIVGALVASRQPRNPIGWILCTVSVYAGVVALAVGYTERYVAGQGGSQRWAEAAAWLANWAWVPLIMIPLAFLPVCFPHGRLPSRRWRVVPWLAGAGMATFAFSQAAVPGPLDNYSEIVNPYGIENVAVEVAGFGSILVFGAGLAGLASLVVRFRRATGVERQQIKWLAYAACVAAIIFIAAGPVSIWSHAAADALLATGLTGLPVAIGIAILRHRLYDIDLLINKTLVYGGLTVGVVAVYVALVGGLAGVFHEQADFWLALVATGLAALLVQPLRSALQRRVNRLMYGPTDEGRSVPGSLRERLHETFAPEAAELQRARERLVAAREEERRRLRRDLHDGLGPALAGAALKVEAAENLLGSTPNAAAELLDDARAEIQTAVADVRRLVYDLRPPALDELGLVGALREQGGRLGGRGAGGTAGVQIDVEAPDDLNGLPAAVEVAAYRIALEAMTNVARHARARSCLIRITHNGLLELEISDDGQGLPSDYRAGVGHAAMRERAEELGGTCEVERLGAGGTRVRARLPLAPS